jgi:large subunit ribosomal protein L19e
MSNLRAQRRMAADVLDVGKNKVYLDPDRQEEIAEAITRADIRDLVDEGVIRADEPEGNSRGRARERQEKRAYGHRKGQGSRKGTAGGRENEKDKWISSIRAQREKLRELRDEGTITRTRYRELYDLAGGGEFDSVADIERTVGES